MGIAITVSNDGHPTLTNVGGLSAVSLNMSRAAAVAAPQVQEMEKMVSDCNARVAHFGQAMLRALVAFSAIYCFHQMTFQDTDALPEAIKHAAMFISELRNSKLGPQHYFELCAFLIFHLFLSQ